MGTVSKSAKKFLFSSIWHNLFVFFSEFLAVSTEGCWKCWGQQCTALKWAWKTMALEVSHLRSSFLKSHTPTTKDVTSRSRLRNSKMMMHCQLFQTVTAYPIYQTTHETCLQSSPGLLRQVNKYYLIIINIYINNIINTIVMCKYFSCWYALLQIYRRK